ncbi:DNA-binding response regulator [Putridiphycobacter roseus]|uniref:DNA-binding response regulator n=1 Tax=Putridiphycobacter roseus TaxID=2219161 RepID=A0A2W1N126_9FLAO|nr:response regulator transcription factor [Putridiphycobacter roseus]PZE17977.1 DNA-binding response regulator [Putridiphycobacter roseus]
MVDYENRSILIVEDEMDLQESMRVFFTEEGFQVQVAKNKFDAEDKLIDHKFDFVILDSGLPDGNGLDLIKVMKTNQKDLGILILSAKNSLDDKLLGLDLGADDYMTKPFHIAELNSRIKAIYRRRQGRESNGLKFKEIYINLDEQSVTVNEIELPLTQKEFQLLVYFINNQRRVLSKESISNHLWESQSDLMGNFDLIYTHIKNLRKKIEGLSGKNYIKSVYGMGYKFISE